MNEGNEIKEWIKELGEKDHNKACKAASELIAVSSKSAEVYTYFDLFVQMVSNDNSYVRNRGFGLMAANARWDTENKVDEAIDAYLKHIMDPKPISARMCIKTLPQIAAAKKELADIIKAALLKADPSKYPDSMAPLVTKDIAWALKEIEKIISQK